MSDLPGLLVLDKPAGITSNQLVGQTKRRLGTRKVGHAGTLDPMATGVMILGANRATRLLGYLLLHDKSYLATIRLGQATDTDDAEGTIISTAGAAGLTREQVAAALPPYRGTSPRCRARIPPSRSTDAAPTISPARGDRRP